jgi:lipopolysaccharide transport system ATP-binding protein
VSHNMPAIESLCTRALMLEGGSITHMGDVREVINEYQKRVSGALQGDGVTVAEMGGPTRRTRIFQSLKLIDDDEQATLAFRMGSRVRFVVGLNASTAVISPRITIGINDTYGHRVLTICTPLSEPVLTAIDGEIHVKCTIDRLPLAPGEYWVKLGLANPGGEMDEIEQVMRFNVLDCDAFGEGRGFRGGTCVAPSKWQLL